MVRGRPVESRIRQNIVEILYFMKRGYGYDIAKAYMQIFPRVTRRSIYYHLKKGVETGEFKIGEIKKEHGDYSWGGEVEKIYYELGSEAKPKMSNKVKKFFDKK
ncbi:hypothetical protein GF336_02635 [Candidatus Woesearchaeota archaeon]|nr:hypothetical protein [Candidatus Woesearchaeota archaeon]